MRKNVITRKITLEDDQDAIDRDLWLALPYEEKFKHMIELSHMLWEIHTGEKIEPRLQRHVVHLHKE
jgi:hypothetical protein